MAILLKADGRAFGIFPSNGKSFQLQEYYSLLSCRLVEIIELHDGRLMVCDEEAKLSEDWSVNTDATLLYRQGRMSHREYRDYLRRLSEKEGFALIEAGEDTLDVIAGDVLVGGRDEIG